MNQKFAKAASTYESMVGHQRAPGGYPSSSAPYGQPQPGPAQHGPPGGQGGQADPYAGWTEQQRREYDAQWAAYHEQMRQYERAQAEYQQQQLALQQQQQHTGPPGPAPQAQAQIEPYWDGAQWVYPQGQPQAAQPPATTTSPPPQANGVVPAAAAAFYHPAQQAHYAEQSQQQQQQQPPAQASYPAQPYPDAGLADQMAAMNVNGHPLPAPGQAPPPQEQQYYQLTDGPPPQAAYPHAVSPQLGAGSPPPPPGQAGSHIYPGAHEPQYPAAAQPWGGQQ